MIEARPGDQADAETALSTAEAIMEAVEDHVLGQRPVVEALLVTYMAGGHALLEGMPGVGKTRLARCFASALGLTFQRVQFTPDLMPADVVGTNVYEQSSGAFRLLRGPIFTQILMADEINRTPPKTQSALLEAMQEGQVTIDGESYVLGDGFFVIATQNPIELEGTYPLPEAQLDRFLARIEVGLPEADAERALYQKAVDGTLSDTALPAPVLSADAAIALRRAARKVHVAPELLDYLAALVAAIRCSDQLELAVSPRAALALLATARSAAFVDGRNHVIPDDFKRFLVPCWGHRIMLTAEAELEGHSAARLLGRLAKTVEVPK